MKVLVGVDGVVGEGTCFILITSTQNINICYYFKFEYED
jgi:hypothetical protein